MASLLPSVKTSLPLATHLSPPSFRDLELQICTLRPSVSPYSCLPLTISLFNLAQSLSLSLSELSPSLSIPLSFDLNVPSFDLSVSKPHDAAFKRLTTTTRRRVASFASKVIGALPVIGLLARIISDEGILFMCCYAIGWLLLVLIL